MEKQFKHKDGNIKVTQGEHSITVDPLEKKEVIKIDSAQSKASILKETEAKLNLIYTGSPAIIKEFIKWLEDVV